MSLLFKIYKHSRTMSLLFVVAGSGSAMVLQTVYFKKIVDSFDSKEQIVNPHYDFSELEKLKTVEKVETKPIPKKPKVVEKQIPDSVINIGNNIKFIGFIKSAKKVFLLVEYNGIEYNLKQDEEIKTEGSNDKIIFKSVDGDYALFKINDYKYRMSVKEKYTDIPLMAE